MAVGVKRGERFRQLHSPSTVVLLVRSGVYLSVTMSPESMAVRATKKATGQLGVLAYKYTFSRSN